MPEARLQDCTDDAIELVRRWLTASAGVKADPGAARLAGVLHDERGFDFALGFVDRVVRPDDPRVAAANLERLSQDVPDFLAWYLRGAVALGGGVAAMAPWAVVPTARRILRRMTGHLVVDAPRTKLGATLAKLAGTDTLLDIRPLGERVFGPDAADRRLNDAREMLEREDVHALTIRVSDVVSPMSLWAFDETVARVTERLLPLFRVAASAPTPKRITLDVAEYRDLDLTIAVFTALLERPEFLRVDAGIALQAYLPDAQDALEWLTDWARDRRARGGAPITIRLVTGDSLPTERVEASLRNWPLATLATTTETDTAYLALLDAALTAERVDAVRIAVASHNLFHVATAWTLATRRNLTAAVDVEMLLGSATGAADAVRSDVGGLRLVTPVVHPTEADAAIPYLATRLQALADTDAAMGSAVAVASEPDHFDRDRDRFLAAIDGLGDPLPVTNRVQDRRAPLGEPEFRDRFDLTPDTDPAIAGNRAWARDILRRVPRSPLGADTLRAARVVDRVRLERILTTTAGAGANWGRQDPADRAELLDFIAHELEVRRGDLIEVLCTEVGVTLTEADAEVSRAIDAASLLAVQARHRLDIDGAVLVPPRLTVVVAPAQEPVAVTALGVVAALAAGSGVVVKPASQAGRSVALLTDILWQAGVPHSLLAVVDIDEEALGRTLVAHAVVDRVLFTGSADTARSFRWWRAGLPLSATSGGRNTIVVTPSADFDLAVEDIVASAFGRAGQQRAAVSLVILVGSVATSERFHRTLVDAGRGLHVAWPSGPAAQLGPLIARPHGTTRDALTVLEAGASWLLEPRALDDSERLWSPGIREGAAAAPEAGLLDAVAPVVELASVDSLQAAIALQNSSDSGLAAGLHSLDAAEVAEWVDSVQAGTLFVNRRTTDTSVGRAPLGGWKRSSIGPTTRPGGPLHLATLGRWVPKARPPHKSIRLRGVPDAVATLIDAARPGLTFEEFDQVRAGALSDAVAWSEEFGVAHDPAALKAERNVLRYRPMSVIVRQSENASTGDLVRVLAAASAARAHILLSTARPLPAPLVQLLSSGRSPLDVVDHLVESDEDWLQRAAAGAIFLDRWSGDLEPDENDIVAALTPSLETIPRTAFGGPGARIRLLGGDPIMLEEALGASVDVTVYDAPVVDAGLLEMLPFVREQVIAMRTHRFGSVDRDLRDLPL
ncbi:proline dehydrogenase family protein [Curtobacterium ammoniigenes]|uniref:proline dehydrogenase family protein n=1 Tax=Curtobacterium ammoniigenes TaxID=395387 RepID=UPI00082B974E|nr:proline dehydrogenase family protein [Curtobacterium ammoniigenes]